MSKYLAAAWLLLSVAANAADIDAIKGDYVFASYQLSLGSDIALNFDSLGVKGATLQIRADGTLRRELQLQSGASAVSEGRIVELKIEGSGGYFIAEWLEYSYPVKEEFTLTPDGFSYVIRFDNPSDAARYGGQEQATLKRASGRD